MQWMAGGSEWKNRSEGDWANRSEGRLPGWATARTGVKVPSDYFAKYYRDNIIIK